MSKLPPSFTDNYIQSVIKKIEAEKAAEKAEAAAAAEEAKAAAAKINANYALLESPNRPVIGPLPAASAATGPISPLFPPVRRGKTGKKPVAGTGARSKTKKLQFKQPTEARSRMLVVHKPLPTPTNVDDNNEDNNSERRHEYRIPTNAIFNVYNVNAPLRKSPRLKPSSVNAKYGSVYHTQTKRKGKLVKNIDLNLTNIPVFEKEIDKDLAYMANKYSRYPKITVFKESYERAVALNDIFRTKVGDFLIANSDSNETRILKTYKKFFKPLKKHHAEIKSLADRVEEHFKYLVERERQRKAASSTAAAGDL